MTEWESYFIPGTETLLNKAGIVDAEQLHRYENEMSGVRALELAENPIKGHFDLPHLRAIHKHLFQDVYSWAGEIRTVGIEKGGNLFTLPHVIESYGGQVFRELAKANHLKGLGNEQFAQAMAHHYAHINGLHPFREGNGRSTRIFLEQLSHQAGYELDFRRTDGKAWNAGARASFDGNIDPMREIFGRIAVPSRAISFEHDGRAEALQKHPELQIAFAALDRATAEARQRLGDASQLERFMKDAKAVLYEALRVGKLGVPGRDAPTRTGQERDLDRG